MHFGELAPPPVADRIAELTALMARFTTSKAQMALARGGPGFQPGLAQQQILIARQGLVTDHAKGHISEKGKGRPERCTPK